LRPSGFGTWGLGALAEATWGEPLNGTLNFNGARIANTAEPLTRTFFSLCFVLPLFSFFEKSSPAGTAPLLLALLLSCWRCSSPAGAAPLLLTRHYSSPVLNITSAHELSRHADDLTRLSSSSFSHFPHVFSQISLISLQNLAADPIESLKFGALISPTDPVSHLLLMFF